MTKNQPGRTLSYIRLMLDGVPADAFDALFYQAIEVPGVLEPFRCLAGQPVIALDGTEHFCSRKIHCPHCLKRKRADGGTEYYHAGSISNVPGALIGTDEHSACRVKPGCSSSVVHAPISIIPQRAGEGIGDFGRIS